jgi:hypothetical protein
MTDIMDDDQGPIKKRVRLEQPRRSSIVRSRPRPPSRPRQRREFEYQPRDARKQQLEVLKPLHLRHGKDTVELKELLVFIDDQRRIVLSVVSSRGTLNIPMKRANVSELVSALTKQLVPAFSDMPDRPAR